MRDSKCFRITAFVYFFLMDQVGGTKLWRIAAPFSKRRDVAIRSLHISTSEYL